MKRMKKIVSILLAAIMVLGMSVTAFATESDSPTTYPKDSGDFTITLDGVENKNHSYSAYQVFKGDLSEEGTGENAVKKLSNIVWGNNINEEKVSDLINALKAITLEDDEKPFESLVATTEGENKQSSAAEVAEILSENVNNSALAIAFADVVGSTTTVEGVTTLNYLTETTYKSSDKIIEKSEVVDGKPKPVYTYTIENLPVGYYLVQDTNNNVAAGEGDAYTRNIMQVVSDVTARVKTSIPTIEKKIVEGENRVDANNAGIGKVVPYEVKGQVPDTTGYDYYFYVINDTMSKGLTFNKDVSITVGGDAVSVYAVPANITTLTEEQKNAAKEADVVVYEENVKDGKLEETRIKIAFNNIMASKFVQGTEILVHYSATVNADAVIGVEGNPNKVTLNYSNNPNYNYDGDKDDNKPGLPDSTKNPPTGDTPEDITITYVAEIDIQKTFSDSGELEILPGATFTLTGTSKQAVLTKKTYYEENPDGDHYLLKDGTYTITAPQVDIEMAVASTSATAGYVRVESADEVQEDGKFIEGVVKVGAYYYRPYKTGDTGTLYTLVEPNVDDYVSAIVKYSKRVAEETAVVDIEVNMVGTTDAEGKLTFKGLGAGTYTITETGVPAGYNKADPITVVIECKVPEGVSVGNEQAIWKLGEGTTTPGVTLNGLDEETNGSTTGKYETTIDNRKGSLLPSTGGIGTTIFYVVGGILVIGAGILLVAKKRMGKN